MTDPVSGDPTSAPPSEPPKPHAPAPPATSPAADGDNPPWGDNFDAGRAWKTIQNQREEAKQLKTQSAADREELEKLRNEKLSADERTLKEAREQAAAEASAAAETQWRGRYLSAELKSVAATVIKDAEQLRSFMAIADPSKFVDDDGEIDEEAVMGHLTAIYAGVTAQRAPRQWGQHSAPGEPPGRPGEKGREAARKRHGIKASS